MFSFADVVALVSTRMSGLVVVVVVVVAAVVEEESGEAGGVFVSGPVGVCTAREDIAGLFFINRLSVIGVLASSGASKDVD